MLGLGSDAHHEDGSVDTSKARDSDRHGKRHKALLARIKDLERFREEMEGSDDTLGRVEVLESRQEQQHRRLQHLESQRKCVFLNATELQDVENRRVKREVIAVFGVHRFEVKFALVPGFCGFWCLNADFHQNGECNLNVYLTRLTRPSEPVRFGACQKPLCEVNGLKLKEKAVEILKKTCEAKGVAPTMKTLTIKDIEVVKQQYDRRKGKAVENSFDVVVRVCEADRPGVGAQASQGPQQ